MYLHRSSLSIFARICLVVVLLLIAFPVHGEALAAAFSTSWLWFTTEDAEEPSLVIDSKNGLHAVFSTLLADNTGKYPSYYAYCPAACSQKDNWSYVNLGDMGFLGGGQSIALTADGNPRVIWHYENTTSSSITYYAQCDGNCGVPANWRTAPIFDNQWKSSSKHYFAIDPQGVAHFTHINGNGTFYASCASNCIDPASWSEVKIGDSAISTMDIKFGPNGQPKLAFWDNTGLVYAECNTACDNIDNWIGTVVTTGGSYGDSFALEVTATGNPRLAFYANQQLSYAWCNTNCLESSNWTITSLGLSKYYGLNIDLELDSQDRPVISYRVDFLADNYGLYYSTCTTGCETTNPTWVHQAVETGVQLDAVAPLPNPNNCQYNFWLDVGVDSSLALDDSDVPQFAYEARNTVSCNGKASMLVKGVRFATAGDSNPVLDKHVYLPAVRR